VARLAVVLRFAWLLTVLAGCDVIFRIDDLHDAGSRDGGSGDGAQGDGGGAISFVQRTFVETGGPTKTCTASLPTQSGPSALLVVTLSHDGPPTGVVTVTDNLGDTYALAIPATTWSGGSFTSMLFYAKGVVGTAPSASPVTVAVTLGAAVPSFCDVYIDEYAGASATAPLDQTSVSVTTTQGSFMAITSGFRTTTTASELIFGHAEGAAVNIALGAGFSMRGADNGNIEEDKLVTAVGTYEARFTVPHSLDSVAMMATFR
jgi:hypothetical protein